ncbi:ABC transporter permease [Ancylobacter amanitiformis]|uniref:Spermidine/putrescine transport system permease protein n=1 Tax=Ancylobacter amanitiformis TaxID=217069 RepID=A0ABU0LPB6_9HYPH|nr:ABC transporter permease [Ancylobacter amanitiformis]MDQ0510546.1 spermidine/putrescine transport system permease protein [Ancylobacter amanitiformis]
MVQLYHRYGALLATLLIAATAIWVLMMVVLPYLVMAEYSFHPNLPMTQQGGPNDVYTLSNYASLFSGIDLLNGELPDDFRVFLRTIWGSTLVTFISLVVCYPVAWHLAKAAKPEQVGLLILLLIIPFWINEILRTFAWYIILAYNGPLNSALLGMGLLDKPYRWLSGSGGVLIGMTYAFILFMMFPLINAIETLDISQVEAARDLGAPEWQIHRRIVIPHAKPGIAVGSIMVFVLAASSYIVPAVLGSPGTRWFTETIYIWFFEGQDWPRGSAYAFILLGLCVVFILSVMRIFRVGLTDIAK